MMTSSCWEYETTDKNEKQNKQKLISFNTLKQNITIINVKNNSYSWAVSILMKNDSHFNTPVNIEALNIFNMTPKDFKKNVMQHTYIYIYKIAFNFWLSAWTYFKHHEQNTFFTSIDNSATRIY